MNKLEAAYAETLKMSELAGSVVAWKFEAIKLRLAKRTWYTPDFVVLLDTGATEFHEVKGHWEDDARVKIKVAAETFPYYKFVAMTRDKRGVWHQEAIG